MKLNEAFVMRIVFDKTILMPIKSNLISNDPILLNATAASILSISKECCNMDELIKKCVLKFGVSQNTVEEQGIRSFICMLYNKGIIQ